MQTTESTFEYKRCLNCGYETEYVSDIEYCYTCEQAFLNGYNTAKEENNE